MNCPAHGIGVEYLPWSEGKRPWTIGLMATDQHPWQAGTVQRLLTGLSQFLNGLNNTAEQLSSRQRWARILAPILAPQAALLVPSG